jgi:DNA gyrase subunit A
MGLKDLLHSFVTFREDVILRRSRFDLGKARERAHLLIGLAIAVANIDEVIRVIRASPDATVARQELMARDWPAGDIGALLALIDDAGNIVVNDTVRLTDAQARGILELRLSRLTGLEREKIQSELAEVATKITELLEIIASRPRRLEVMTDELRTVRAEIATPRMTAIVDAAADQDDESLIEPGQMVVTITRDGFIKRTPLDAFRQQMRGGRGRSAAGMRGDDVVTRSFNAHTHQWVLFFSSGACRRRSPPPRAGRWSTCCPISAATRSPPCCRCRRTRRCGTICTSCSPRRAAGCAATSCPISAASAPPG